MPIKPTHAALRHHLAVWLLALATLFSALAPMLSHALVLARGESASMLAVCTSAGMSWVSNVAPTDSPNGQESAPSQKSCPFCLLALERAAPPPHPLTPLCTVSGDHETPMMGQAIFSIATFALTPPPRGPPAFF